MSGEIPPLPPTTILLVEVGSTAHGTARIETWLVETHHQVWTRYNLQP